MAKISRRDKKNLAKQNRSSKDKFKDWYQAKKKVSKRKEKEAKQADGASRREARQREAPGRGAGRGSGKGSGRGSGGSASPSLGRGFGRGGGKETSALAPGLEHEFGASTAIMNRLIEMKQKLLGGNVEDSRRQKPIKPSGPDGKGTGKGLKGKGPAQTGYQARRRDPVVREELVPLNQELNRLGRTRNLERARAILTDLEERGWANGFTYTAAISTLCRCGDWKRAEEALARATKIGTFRSGKGVESGVIARTAMIKGYFDCERDLVRAKRLFAEMEAEKNLDATPNTRTANTFLRGCLLLGAVSEAQQLLARMEAGTAEKILRATPDASSYETVVALLCQALQVEAADEVAKRSLKQLGKSPGSAVMFVSIARAAAIKEDWTATNSAVTRARKLLDAEQQYTLGSGGGNDAAGSGGKRGAGPAKQETEESTARGRSLGVFQEHRRSELYDEIREIVFFATRREAPDLKTLWSRTLVFEDRLHGEASPDGAVASSLRDRLCESFGLEADSEDARAVRKAFKAALKKSVPNLVEEEPPKKKKKDLLEDGDGKIDSKLDLRNLFPLGTSSKGSRPLHLEICSGDGQWLGAQAKLDEIACWVACEVRYDRVAKCFQRFALRDLSADDCNVGMIAGDAHDALTKRLQSASCTRLFINHPEPIFPTAAPPDGAGSNEATKQKPLPSEQASSVDPLSALITPDFLRKGCAAVLRPGGTLTICTDNEDYGRYLLDMIDKADMAKLFDDALGKKQTKKALAARLATAGRFSLQARAPPIEACGAQYQGEAGKSYFQRLKENEKGSRGQKDKRYFLCLRRRKKERTSGQEDKRSDRRKKGLKKKLKKGSKEGKRSE